MKKAREGVPTDVCWRVRSGTGQVLTDTVSEDGCYQNHRLTEHARHDEHQWDDQYPVEDAVGNRYRNIDFRERFVLARLGAFELLPDGNTALGMIAQWIVIALVVTPVVLAHKWLSNLNRDQGGGQGPRRGSRAAIGHTRSVGGDRARSLRGFR